MKSPAELTELFRSRGLKMTPQRQCIFRILHGNEVHPTAEAVYAAAAKEMPTISLKTVYQTLNDLASMGEIQQLDLGTGSTRFDPNTDGHHHVVCNRCGKVRDLYVNPRVRVPADQLDGFTIDSTEVVLRGLCDECSPSPTRSTGDVHA
ncbi:MAG TPA: Fur family transcriptional regulator [Acidimicrobiales bacterium]|nr:Fur family transcriptional regulator [Acidimicrobiales bacterium]